MNENEKVSLTREELNAMLKEAARRGAEDAKNAAPEKKVIAAKEVYCDAEDAKALEFIATFQPRESEEPLQSIFPYRKVKEKLASWLPGILDDLQGKIDEYNAFESKIEPYYDYADEPEDLDEELSGDDLTRYQKKHEIYLALHQEKVRRFGFFFGYGRGKFEISQK